LAIFYTLKRVLPLRFQGKPLIENEFAMQVMAFMTIAAMDCHLLFTLTAHGKQVFDFWSAFTAVVLAIVINVLGPAWGK